MTKRGKTDVVVANLPPKVVAAMEALEVNEKRFVVAYCGEARGNGALAAQMSGARGTAANRASVSVRRLRNPLVRAAVSAWMQAYAMDATEITARITDLTQINPLPFFEVNKDGKLALKEKIPPDVWEKHAHWVKSVRTNGEGLVIDLELHDPMQAYRELAKINKLYSDAPIFAFHLYLSQMSDADLLRQLEEARNEDAHHTTLRPPGEEVAVVDPPA